MPATKTRPFNVVEYLDTPEKVAAYVAETDAEHAELRAENARLRARLADYMPPAFTDEELAILQGPRPSEIQLASLIADDVQVMQDDGRVWFKYGAALSRDQFDRNCRASVGMSEPLDDHGEGEG